MIDEPDLHLGLIGDNILRSRAPLLHRIVGEQNGLRVRYDRLIPKEMGEDFDSVFGSCAGQGYRGVNVTLPYKERVAKKVRIDDPMVAAIGAVNTVIFEPDGPRGLNTDYTGFIAAYRNVRRDKAPGKCCLIGTGGVGRALAFGLLALDASELRLVDQDRNKAEALAADLAKMAGDTEITVETDAQAGTKGASGLLNGTPLGMDGYGGTPLRFEAMAGAEWAFDAVYTPVDTQFLSDAAQNGLEVISGYELFFYQGVHAWAHFSDGKPLDEEALRIALLETEDAA